MSDVNIINFDELVKNLQIVSEEDVDKVFSSLQLNLQASIELRPQDKCWSALHYVKAGMKVRDELLKRIREKYTNTGISDMEFEGKKVHYGSQPDHYYIKALYKRGE